MADRAKMMAELKRTVLPYLRSAGFKGSFPHFRRPQPDMVDLITFQFDQRGRGLVIELARCPISGTTTHWGEHIPAAKVRAWDIHPNFRSRLKKRPGGDTESWFRFDVEPPEKVANDIFAKLSSNDVWDRIEIGRSSLKKAD